MGLSKEQILKADDLRTVDVDVPEWGGSVRLKTMTAKERQTYQAALADGKGGKMPVDFMERFVSACAVDDKGQRIFDGAEDIKALGDKSAVALGRLFEAALELNGTTEKAVETIKGE